MGEKIRKNRNTFFFSEIDQKFWKSDESSLEWYVELLRLCHQDEDSLI